VESGAGEVLVAGGPAEFGAGSNAVTGNRYTRLAWEQTRLALLARAAWAVMNLGNLAPLAASNNLVLIEYSASAVGRWSMIAILPERSHDNRSA